MMADHMSGKNRMRAMTLKLICRNAFPKPVYPERPPELVERDKAEEEKKAKEKEAEEGKVDFHPEGDKDSEEASEESQEDQEAMEIQIRKNIDKALDDSKRAFITQMMAIDKTSGPKRDAD